MMVNASVEVQLYNEMGDRVGTAPGLLTSTSIQPDGTVEFRANFPGVFTFASAKFDVGGLPLNMTSTQQKPADSRRRAVTFASRADRSGDPVWAPGLFQAESGTRHGRPHRAAAYERYFGTPSRSCSRTLRSTVR